jgi:hypothetical protein
MAQRAYRQRKESTLDELRKQVSDLESKLQLMNKTFGECRDYLAASGLRGDQLRALDEASAQFESVTGATRPTDDDSPPALTHSSPASSSGVQTTNESVKVPEGPNYVPSWLDKAAIGYQPSRLLAQDIGMGYTVDPQAQSTASSSRDFIDQSAPSPDSYAVFRVEEPQIAPSLRVPKSYSNKELTFGRYLHRAAMEKGYQVLLEPDRWPLTYERAFKLSLMNRGREKLMADMKRALARSPMLDLDMETSPLVHVGGAGTHYARRDHTGALRPKKEVWNLGIVGPQALAMLDDAAQNGLSVDMTVQIAGFEGEWFDPYDVEGYLAEKGITLDPASPFAVVELPNGYNLPSPQATLSSEPFNHEQSLYLKQHNVNLDDMYTLPMEALEMDEVDWLDLSPPLSMPFNSLSDQHSLGYFGSRPFLQERRKKKVVIDVAKFVRSEF